MAKNSAFGATFQRLISATWTDVAQVAKVGDFSITRETIDVTTHDGDGYREFLGTIRDMEELDLTLVFDQDDASHEYFRDQVDAGSNASGETFRTRLSTSANETWEFTGIVTGFALTEREIEGRLEAVVTFKPSGQPDFTV